MKIKEDYLENLEEAETYLLVKEGLERLEALVRTSSGDLDLLYLIDYLREENEGWGPRPSQE